MTQKIKRINKVAIHKSSNDRDKATACSAVWLNHLWSLRFHPSLILKISDHQQRLTPSKYLPPNSSSAGGR